jgi:hypothetical protein
MKHFFIFLILLLPMMSFGQSKEADEYYNKGIKLHESKQAHLAIPYFEKSDSLEKKELKKTRLIITARNLCLQSVGTPLLIIITASRTPSKQSGCKLL